MLFCHLKASHGSASAGYFTSSKMLLFGVLLIAASASSVSSLERIVNGEEVTPHSYPAQLSLQKDNGHICGAVLVTPGYAITAAHCLGAWDNPKSYRIQCGAHNIHQHESFRQTAAVARFVRHPGFDITSNRPYFPNDIAVLKLASPVDITRECQTANLASGSYDYADQDAMITGWGRLYGGSGPFPDTLREGSVTVLSHNTCTQNYWGATSISPYFHICVKDLGDKIYGGCNGDSGGPAHVGNTIVGLTSFGSGACLTQYPTVYTRVSFYRDWIDQTMAVMGRE